MIDYMNSIFDNKGIEVKSVIITNVTLPKPIADNLETKTTFASKNTLARKAQSYNLRVMNDNQTLQLIHQQKIQERQAEKEQFERQKAEVLKEHNLILADTKKLLAEIESKSIAAVSQIIATGELEAQQIISETKVIRARILAEGRAKANQIEADIDNYVLTKKAETEKKVAEYKSKEIKVTGAAEAQLAKLLENR